MAHGLRHRSAGGSGRTAPADATEVPMYIGGGLLTLLLIIVLLIVIF
jgi:hypothetical protein